MRIVKEKRREKKQQLSSKLDQFRMCLCVCVHEFSPQFALSFDSHAVSLVCAFRLIRFHIDDSK